MGSNVNLIPKSITTTNHISYLTVTVAALVLVSRFTGFCHSRWTRGCYGKEEFLILDFLLQAFFQIDIICETNRIDRRIMMNKPEARDLD